MATKLLKFACICLYQSNAVKDQFTLICLDLRLKVSKSKAVCGVAMALVATPYSTPMYKIYSLVSCCHWWVYCYIVTYLRWTWL